MQRFASVLLLARLLAKFLGFLSFLPYQTSETPSGEIKEAAISLRNKVCLGMKEKHSDFVQIWLEWILTTRLCLSECSSPGCLRSAEQKREEEAHHPDCAVAGGVPVNVGLHWSFVDLLQDCIGHTASTL